MPKRTSKKFLLLITIGLTAFGYLGFSFWQNRRTIPDYIPPITQKPTEQKSTEKPLVIVAVGDIACSSKSPHYNAGNGNLVGCHMKATANLTKKLKPDVVLVLGDNQYENGETSEYEKVYGSSWGASELKQKTKPVPGNHEYNVGNASGYYEYFGKAAGDPSKGYNSFDKGKWHFAALNSNCKYVSCAQGSVQQNWLSQDLAANKSKCTLAYWHHPIFSSGTYGSDSRVKDLYQTLLNDKADIVLSGHDHLYERFARQDVTGKASASGISNFIVGTGGKSLYPFRKLKPNSEARISSSFGVMKLALLSDRYSWEFIAENGRILDSGSDRCI